MENKGYPVRRFEQSTRRYVQTMRLRGDAALIARYCEAHDEAHFWREIGEGIRSVGILEMEIFIDGDVLVMVVEAPDNFRWDEAMARLATLPRQQEWEDHVAQWQDCSAGATSAAKWSMMRRMFHLYDSTP